MLGSIAGDIVGSVYENLRTKRKDFRLFNPLSTFTDDTVLTVAVADAILCGSDYCGSLKSFARRYPMRGYGGSFIRWFLSPDSKPYNSYANGSAMRVSPVAHAFETETDVLREARDTAECTHNHPEGIKGAEATVLAVFLARIGSERETIRRVIQERFKYDLSRTVDDIRPDYSFDISCQGSVPESIIAFLDSSSFEDALRNAISLGGDSDTQACIAGAIAEAYYKSIPLPILRQIKKKLSKHLWKRTLDFYERYGIREILEQLQSDNLIDER